MKTPFKINQKIHVAGAGQRGNHGCTAGATLLVQSVRRLDGGMDGDWEVTGVLIESTECFTCGETFRKVGQVITVSGWHDPDYYGHDGLQC